MSTFLKMPAGGSRVAIIPPATVSPADDLSATPLPDAYDPATAPAKYPPSVPPVYPRITLRLRNVSIIGAFEQISKACGMKFKLEPFAASIVPADKDIKQLTTVEIDVPANFFRRIGGKGTLDVDSIQPPDADRSTVKAFLEAAGMRFSPGGSATYLPSVRMIIRPLS